MSFTSIVKNEISKINSLKAEELAQLSAIFRNISVIDNNVKITTENASVARKIFNSVKDLYKINSNIIVRRGYNFNKKYLYILIINNKNKDILNDLSIMDKDGFVSVPKSYLTDDDELIRAYLRGLFMAIGSINDPKKSRYHLEFLLDDGKYAYFINELLSKFFLNSKVIKRETKYMVYIKEAEKISDFLRIIKANNAVLYYEDIRIYRDHKNMTNRLNNCEQANVDKTVKTALDQVSDIKLIEETGGLELLDSKIQTAAVYRLKYPYTSLNELSQIISLETGNKITKSGLYHRFCKIKKLAEKIDKAQNKN